MRPAGAEQGGVAGVEDEAEVVEQPPGDLVEHVRCHVEHPPADVALDVGVLVLGLVPVLWAAGASARW